MIDNLLRVVKTAAILGFVLGALVAGAVTIHELSDRVSLPDMVAKAKDRLGIHDKSACLVSDDATKCRHGDNLIIFGPPGSVAVQVARLCRLDAQVVTLTQGGESVAVCEYATDLQVTDSVK